MSVLRRVESLGRSYLQNLRKCRVGATAPRYPKIQCLLLSSSPVSVYSVHAFSTSSANNDDVRPVSFSNALEVASREAREISSRANASNQCPQEAIQAANAMLTLTSDTIALLKAISEKEANAEQVACLHQALIAVTSWCVSLASSPADEMLVECAVDLARRADILTLPLHLPLYQSLVTVIAQCTAHDDDDDTEDADTILEVANMAVSGLETTLQDSFFEDALVSLVERREIKQAITVRKAMEERFDVHIMDINIFLKIMKALNESLDKRSPDVDLYQEAVFTDVMVDGLNKNILTNALQQSYEIKYSEEDDSESNGSEDEIESLVNRITEMQEACNNLDAVTDAVIDAMNTVNTIRSKIVEARFDMNAGTGELEGFNALPPPQEDSNEKEEKELAGFDSDSSDDDDDDDDDDDIESMLAEVARARKALEEEKNKRRVVNRLREVLGFNVLSRPQEDSNEKEEKEVAGFDSDSSDDDDDDYDDDDIESNLAEVVRIQEDLEEEKNERRVVNRLREVLGFNVLSRPQEDSNEKEEKEVAGFDSDSSDDDDDDDDDDVESMLAEVARARKALEEEKNKWRVVNRLCEVLGFNVLSRPDDIESMLAEVVRMQEDLEEVKNERRKVLDALKANRSKMNEVQVDINAETGEPKGFNVTPPQEDSDEQEEEELDMFAKDMIYLRDSNSWLLPDVTQQLVELNGGRDALYTRQYEEQILKDVLSSSRDDVF